MRNPERIDIILHEISNIWRTNPDLRLVQLLLNAIGTFDQSSHEKRFNDVVKDHYNTEDDVVLDALRKTYDTGN